MAMGNTAIDSNPSNAQLSITTHGSDWLWAVFCIMMVSDLAVFIWQFTIPRGQRVFHQMSIIILSTASVAYFSMASNLGYTPVPTEYAYLGYAAGVTRQIWYVRYIDWIVTTPALLLTLVLASGLPLSDIVTLIFFDILMIVTGLVGALVESQYKWAFWAFGTAALFYIWYVLAGPARSSALAISREAQKAYTLSAGVLGFLWLLYPIAWALSDGASVIYPDSEMIFYGILDVLAKPVFCFIHLNALRKVDFTSLQLTSGKFSESANGVTTFDREKNATAANTTTGTKRGFFGNKGRYDAPAATGNHVAAPRTSEATAVNA